MTPNPRRDRSGKGHFSTLRRDPDCSVVIVNYHSEALLGTCLDSLPAAAGTLAVEVIVVDNSGTLRASGVLEGRSEVRVIEAGANVGFARACNLGMAEARGRHLLLLNPDTLAHPCAVETLVGHMEAIGDAGVVAARLLNPDGTLQYSCRRFPRPLSILFGRYAVLTRLFPGNRFSRDYLYLEWDHASVRSVDWVSGACLMVRREVLDRVGGLDDGYFLFVEDMDWCRRIRDAGMDVVYVPEAEVTHRIGASRGPVPAWVIWERHHSMLRYVEKHFGWTRALVALARAGLLVRGLFHVLEDRLRRRPGAGPLGLPRPAPILSKRPISPVAQRVPVPARLPPG